MPRDYYAEEIEGKPSRDYYAEEIENKIPPSEGFLKRALGQGFKTAGNTLGQMIPGQDVPFHPFGTVTGEARKLKERGLEGVTSGIKNPFLRFGAQVGLDPETYIGGGKAVSEKVPQEMVKGAKTVGNAIDGVTREVRPFMQSIKKLKSMEKGDTSIQEAARSGLFGRRAKLSSEFDKDLSSLPETTHDITEIVDKVGALAEFNPSVQSQIRKSPMMQRLLKTPEIASDLTTKQFQALRNEFGKGINYQSGKLDSTVRDLLDDMRWKQAEPFPEAMQGLRTKYAKGIEAFKTARPKFSKTSLTGNIRTRFGNNPEVLKDIKIALPEETFNELDTLGRHQRIANTGYSIVKGGGYAGAGALLLDKIFGQK